MAGEDDRPTLPCDFFSRRVEVVDAQVAGAPRELLGLRRSDSPLTAAWRAEREVLAHRELDGLEPPAEDFLQEVPRHGGFRARELPERHLSVPMRGLFGLLPCHRPPSLGRARLYSMYSI